MCRLLTEKADLWGGVIGHILECCPGSRGALDSQRAETVGAKDSHDWARGLRVA